MLWTSTATIGCNSLTNKTVSVPWKLIPHRCKFPILEWMSTESGRSSFRKCSYQPRLLLENVILLVGYYWVEKHDTLTSIVYNIMIIRICCKKWNQIRLCHICITKCKECRPLYLSILTQKSLQVLQALCNRSGYLWNRFRCTCWDINLCKLAEHWTWCVKLVSVLRTEYRLLKFAEQACHLWCALTAQSVLAWKI